ncbi:protein PF3D7_1417600-like [Nymphalis io]|uniref:protein PF3D7_1417600-like n=1 Tax=Inachis io TaxID=171585 RepID=UPI002168B010|nr:protein PF3D7_1417600-like [Nymphalis io]
MDVSKLLKNVNNLNDYISATQDLITKFSNSKIQFNMSTVLALNKIRSIEIEYFNKCDENGVALKILELMLQTPPSKTWGLLGKELISLMRYWLDALRKHLIVHNNHWWNFLSVLLKFIQEICLKNRALNDILVQETAECLLDIATRNQPNIVQRYKIIQCLNKFCAESSREVRFALRIKLEFYFIKLSRIMVSCGDLRTQYGIIETLLRWLIPRQDLAVRRDASAKWFPSSLYGSKAVDIFLRRQWQNFLRDARDFLNALNEASDDVTSVLCRKFSVGNIHLISGTDKKDYWLDLNTGSKCISVMLEPKLLEVLGSSFSLCETLVINEDNTNAIQMHGGSEILITLTVMDPQSMHPSNVLEGCDVTIAISSRSDLGRVDRVLRNIFDNKYQLLIDIKKSRQLSPIGKHEGSRGDKSEDEGRFSHPVDFQRRKHSGYIIRPRNPVSWQSPSTASTSSLAMLREKLTAFPGYRFDKEPVSVCALPQLSSVTEVSETDERYGSNASQSTLKIRPYGVCHKKYRSCTDRTSHSDTESVKKKEDKTPCISPVINDDDNSISCLLVATIGSASDSVINDTLERLPKDKNVHTDSIVDMLAQEALNSSRKIDEIKFDSGVITSEKKSQDNDCLIENTPFTNITDKVKKSNINKKSNRVNNSTTTDESNTEVIEDTQHFADIRNKDVINDCAVKQTYDIQAVEEFFSQHCIENRKGDLVISPTLAKKINETSSDTSESFDFCPIMNEEADFNEAEIIECINEIVDTVCQDFEKCSQYLYDDASNKKALNKNVKCEDKNQEILKDNRKPVKEIKLMFKNTKKQVKTRARKKNKLNTTVVKRMSPIIERDSVIERTDTGNNPDIPSKQSDDFETPLIKRKRKLYSPKDDHVLNERTGAHISETEEDNTILSGVKRNEKTPKSLATSYKDIENLRRTSIRKLRDRKSKSVPTLSPRTKNMNDMFDNLKKTIEGEEKVVFANKKTRNKHYAVYNFTSDSDDEDFKIKKNTKNLSQATNKSSLEPRDRRKRSNTKVNYSELNNDSTDEQSNKNMKRKNVRQRIKKNERKPRILKPKNDMIDERMRKAAPEMLNTSLIIEQQEVESNEPQPSHVAPQMELIADENIDENKITNKKRSKRNKTDLSLKKVKTRQSKIVTDITSDRDKTESPLPGLIIETEQGIKDADESISVQMLEKFKDTCRDTIPDMSELNNTQNLLSDLDHNNNSPKLNITYEFNNVNEKQYNLTPVKKIKTEKAGKDRTKINKSKNNSRRLFKPDSINNKSESNIDIINISDRLDLTSDRTIATIGKSPITGHGDFDEMPPSTKYLKQSVQPRGLETQDLNQSMKEYFNKLTNELNEAYNNCSNNSSKSIEDEKVVEKSTTVTANIVFEKSPTVSIQRLSAKEISKWLPPRYNSVFGSHQSSDSGSSIRQTRSCARKSIESNSDRKENTKEVYKSIISPVKLFGESQKSNRIGIESHKSVSSQGDDYVNRIKSLMTKKKEVPKPIISQPKAPKYQLRKYKNVDENNSFSSSKVSTSTDLKDQRSVKRKSSPVFELKKMRKIDVSVDSVPESGPSCSSVRDWLRRNEREQLINTEESMDLSLKDNLENIIEKLDTTLVEIHHKTSKKFVSMFVETQKHLNELKERRHAMFKETAMEVMSEVVKVMDTKFADFDRRSQELDEQFISNIKEKAQHLIHEDCKQKRVMVTLLKEDIQSVIQHIKRSN